jgi:hypothetical protein
MSGWATETLGRRATPLKVETGVRVPLGAPPQFSPAGRFWLHWRPESGLFAPPRRRPILDRCPGWCQGWCRAPGPPAWQIQVFVRTRMGAHTAGEGRSLTHSPHPVCLVTLLIQPFNSQLGPRGSYLGVCGHRSFIRPLNRPRSAPVLSPTAKKVQGRPSGPGLFSFFSFFRKGILAAPPAPSARPGLCGPPELPTGAFGPPAPMALGTRGAYLTAYVSFRSPVPELPWPRVGVAELLS